MRRSEENFLGQGSKCLHGTNVCRVRIKLVCRWYGVHVCLQESKRKLGFGNAINLKIICGLVRVCNKFSVIKIWVNFEYVMTGSTDGGD